MIRVAIAAALLLWLAVPSAASACYAFAGGAFSTCGAAGGGAVAVPNVITQTEANADTALEAEGLDTGATTDRCSTAMIGIVVGQTPAPGVMVALGTAVDLLISTGVECATGKAGVRLKGLRMRGL